jgi:N-acetylneuraminic acid mutarotase
MSGLIYVVGGMVGTQESDVDSSVHRFDPAANLWSAVADMSTPRAGLTSFVLGGRLYAAGGYSGVDDLSSVERYNAVSDSWETVDGMELSGPQVDFGAQVMRLEVGLFDSLETKARRAHN